MKPVTMILIAGAIYLATRKTGAEPAPAESRPGPDSDNWLSDLAGPTVAGWLDNLFGGSETDAETAGTVAEPDTGFGTTPDLGDYSLTPPTFDY